MHAPAHLGPHKQLPDRATALQVAQQPLLAPRAPWLLPAAARPRARGLQVGGKLLLRRGVCMLVLLGCLLVGRPRGLSACIARGRGQQRVQVQLQHAAQQHQTTMLRPSAVHARKIPPLLPRTHTHPLQPAAPT